MAFRFAMIVTAAVAGLAVTDATTLPVLKADSCELENSFKYEECGTENDVKVCCTPEQACVSAEPWEGDEHFECSVARKLSGNKIVKILLLPLVLTFMFLGVAGFLITKFPKGLDTGLCIKQVILSVFLLFSPVWPLALYTVILNFLVASGVTMKGLAWWAYRLLFVLQIFHIIAVFGPFETFHVPFGDLSTYAGTAGTNLEALAGGYSASEAACSAYYEGYFTLLSIELTRKDVNPNQGTFGYCLEEWLTTVQFLVVVVGVVQCVIAFRTGQLLLNTTPTAGKDEGYNAHLHAEAPESSL